MENNTTENNKDAKASNLKKKGARFLQLFWAYY